MESTSVIQPFSESMKTLLQERLSAKGWTMYRLAKEYGAQREGKPPDQIVASRYNSIVSKCLSSPDKTQVRTLIDIAQCLDISLVGRVTEVTEVNLS